MEKEDSEKVLNSLKKMKKCKRTKLLRDIIATFRRAELKAVNGRGIHKDITRERAALRSVS